MTAFEQHLRKLDGLINVKDEDRRPYTAMFEEVKTWLFNEMKKVDPVFGKLFAGTCLFGSYTNGVRLLKPDEFDMIFLLKFPHPMQFRMDVNNPGFAVLQLNDTLEHFKNDPNSKNVYETFNRLVDRENGLLRRSNFQLWIHNIIEKVVQKRCPLQEYEISFNYLAVAHCFKVSEKSAPFKKISIDFVPAIFLDNVDMKRALNNPPFKKDYFNTFYAVPKAASESGLYTFLIVNPEAEHELLWDKQNLKIVYRLLKSLRDHCQLKRMKSYFLTITFLWEVERCHPDVWRFCALDNLFLNMLKKLCCYFEQGELPYFWDPQYNLLDILKPEEIRCYSDKLKSAYDILNTYPCLINEQSLISKYLPNLI